MANNKRGSCYKWLRKDVDNPEDKQLQLAKKALLTKLNELEIRKFTIFFHGLLLTFIVN